jgi:amidohydrolase
MTSEMRRERVRELIAKYEKAVIEHYRWLHAHPELSGQEKETAAYIGAQLRKMGLEPTENLGGYGVSAVIRGENPGKCIGLRADFDALPMTECTGLPFASQNPGVMHACGHDAHTAMLLGAGLVLNELRDTFNGCVKLIFQPSEENSADSGAKKMIADGVMEDPHVDAIIGQHVDPQKDTGVIATKAGVLSASSDRFFITVEGKSSHAARPHMGVDAIAVGAQIVTALQTIVARNVEPTKNAVVTIGKFNGGTRYNTLAGRVDIEGTCRNHDQAVRDMIEQRIESIVKGITEGMGADYVFRYLRGYSPVINDPQMTHMICETVKDLFGAEHLEILSEAGLGGEDFCFFAEKVPGVFYRTGCHKAGEPVYSGHNEHMVVDPACFPLGMQVMVNGALNYLNCDGRWS